MKVYIAGPMTGLPGYNFAEFDKARDAALAMGWEVISPADEDRKVGVDGTPETEHVITEQWIENQILKDCHFVADVEGVVFLEGFFSSKGARVEFALTEFLKRKTFIFVGGKIIPFRFWVQQFQQPLAHAA